VTVYDAVGLDLEQTLTGFEEPAHIAVNPNTNKIYVANHSLNSQIIVIHGDTHATDRIGAWLLDAYGVTVDTARNLIYTTSIAEGRLSVIDGNTDQGLAYMDIWRSDGRKVPLRVVTVNSGVGLSGHLLLTTSSEDRGEDQVLLIPNGWPALGTPVPLDIARYPLEGIALDPDADRVWVTSVHDGSVSVVQDGEPVCLLPFSAAESRESEFRFRVVTATTGQPED
jgi:DNA-binding beta-propeller fold protein YncE